MTEPVFEADFLPSSFGFRPKLAAHDALQVLIDEAWRGRRWVVETDIVSCFESISHDRLMVAVEERICDRNLLKLVRAMLRAGVMESGVVQHSATGTPQGGVMSPLLANVYLHRLDREWEAKGTGVLVRYADDLVVLCRNREEAERALSALRDLLGELGLELKAEKTRIVHLREGGEGFDFLGFEHRWVRAERNKNIQFLARWPSRRAMQRARDRVRELTTRSRLLLSPSTVVADVNRYLHGWVSYFRYGNSAQAASQGVVGQTAGMAPPSSLRTVSPCPPSGAHPARWARRYATADEAVAGSAACRPVTGIGEPCAKEPHARFEVAGAGDGRCYGRGVVHHRETGLESTRPGPTARTAPAPDPTRR